MTYQKLCQLYADDSTGTNGQGQETFTGSPVIYYLEDCNGNILVNNIPSFPINVKCEIITWATQSGFTQRSASTAFTTATVSVTASPIRSNVFAQLTAIYPGLNE
jgi:hypothetical protein